MVASAAAVTASANALASAITHWGLLNASNVELSGGSYARIASAGTNSSGTVRPTADLTFAVPAGVTVHAVRAYSASSGGTDYGGWNLSADEVYGSAGQYVVTAASSGFPFTAV